MISAIYWQLSIKEAEQRNRIKKSTFFSFDENGEKLKKEISRFDFFTISEIKMLTWENWP